MRAASFRALLVSCTTKRRPTSDTNKIIAVMIHGRMRLLNGLEAKFKLALTKKIPHRRATRVLVRRIHAVTKHSQIDGFESRFRYRNSFTRGKNRFVAEIRCSNHCLRGRSGFSVAAIEG